MSSLHLIDKGSHFERPNPAGGASRTAMEMRTNNNRTALWRYGLLGLAAIYVVLSLYLMLDTRSHLSSFKRTQQFMNEKLWMRQAFTENDLQDSKEAFAQRLGVTEQELHQGMQARAAALSRQQRTVEKQLQAQQQEQTMNLSTRKAFKTQAPK